MDSPWFCNLEALQYELLYLLPKKDCMLDTAITKAIALFLSGARRYEHKSSNNPRAAETTGKRWAAEDLQLWTLVSLLILCTSLYVADVMIQRIIFLFLRAVKLSNLSPSQV